MATFFCPRLWPREGYVHTCHSKKYEKIHKAYHTYAAPGTGSARGTLYVSYVLKLVQTLTDEHYPYRLCCSSWRFWQHHTCSLCCSWCRLWLTDSTHYVYAAAGVSSGFWTKCIFHALRVDPCKTSKRRITYPDDWEVSTRRCNAVLTGSEYQAKHIYLCTQLFYLCLALSLMLRIPDAVSFRFNMLYSIEAHNLLYFTIKQPHMTAEAGAGRDNVAQRFIAEAAGRNCLIYN